MVMHARKLPRLNDGYYDRHQEYSYQAQGSRHNSSSSSKNGHSSRYNYERSSRCSSNDRFESPESSPHRNRSYANKSSYFQRYENERDNRYDKERDSGRYDRDKDRCLTRYDRDREKDRYERERDGKYDKDKEFKYDKDRETKYEKERAYKYEKEKDVRYSGLKDKYYSEYQRSPKRSANKDSNRDYNHQNHNERTFAEKSRMHVSASADPMSPTTPPITIIPKSVAPPLPTVPPLAIPAPPTLATFPSPVLVVTAHSTVSSAATSTNPSVPLPVHNSKISTSTNSHTSTAISNSSATTVSVISTRESVQKRQIYEHSEQPAVKEKFDDNDRLIRIGDWSEHLSNTTGKYYYFNSRTKDCQWHKPLEWLERENALFSVASAANKEDHDKHSSSQPSLAADNSKSGSFGLSNSVTSSSNELNHSQQDMDICSASSTPTSETCNSVADPRLINYDVATTSVNASPTHGCSSSLMMGPFSSQTPQIATSLIASSAHRIIPHASSSASSTSSSIPSTPINNCRRLSLTGAKVDGSEIIAERGPPTPVHSEIQDPVNADSTRKSSPASGGSVPNSVTLPSTTASTTTTATTVVASSSSSSFQPTRLNIHFTTSLSQYVRDDLIGHVRNWPSETIEKQANKIREERCVVHYAHMTKIDYELKSIRSRARVAEIMATTDEQRFLMAREKMKQLENTRPPASVMAMDESI